MKFAIRRASLRAEEGSPLKNQAKLAKKLNLRPDKYPYYDIRGCASPTEIPIGTGSNGKWWYKEGTEHCVIDGKIQRRLDDLDCWAIDINSLEDIMAIVKECGEIVIGMAYSSWDLRTGEYVKEILIYDSYIE